MILNKKFCHCGSLPSSLFPFPLPSLSVSPALRTHLIQLGVWGARSSPPSPSLPFPPLPSLRSRTPYIQLGGLGERCELPSGVWGGAPAEVEFVAF